MQTVTPAHPRWGEFLERLTGPEGCNFTQAEATDLESFTWQCGGGEDQSRARAILKRMGCSEAEVQASLQYYRNHGGYCDCEIALNVDRSADSLTL